MGLRVLGTQSREVIVRLDDRLEERDLLGRHSKPDHSERRHRSGGARGFGAAAFLIVC